MNNRKLIKQNKDFEVQVKLLQHENTQLTKELDYLRKIHEKIQNLHHEMLEIKLELELNDIKYTTR